MVLKAIKILWKKNKFRQKIFSGNFLKFRNFPKFLSVDISWKSCEKQFFHVWTHLVHRPFASNATSCMAQQLLLRYQIPQYDRHHFPVTGILLISWLAETGFRQNNVDGKLTYLCAYYLRHFIFTVHVQISSNYIKAVFVTPYFTYLM